MPTVIPPEEQPERPSGLIIPPPVAPAAPATTEAAQTPPDPVKIRVQVMSVLTAVRGGNKKIAGELLSEMNPEDIKVGFLFLAGSFNVVLDQWANEMPKTGEGDVTGDMLLQMLAKESFK